MKYRPKVEVNLTLEFCSDGRGCWALATAAATVVLITGPLLAGAYTPLVQLAVLDIGGNTRGSDDGELKLLKQTWLGQGWSPSPVLIPTSLGDEFVVVQDLL